MASPEKLARRHLGFVCMIRVCIDPARTPITWDADMNAKDAMLAELKARDPRLSLGQKFYTDPDFYRLDLETIFYRDWMFAGHDCEIPAPGDYFTMTIGDYPIIVVRGQDGAIRALHNSCRHRGSRICPEPRGTAKRLVCPYHQWTYALDGELLRTRHMEGAVDKTQFGLKSAHCESVGGYIFVCVAPVAPSFEPFRALAKGYLAPHRIADAKLAFESTIVENGNWKLVWENNRECYHCAANHPELCRTFPETPAVTGVEGVVGNREIMAHWDRCEAAGLPSVFRLSESGQYRVCRVPLLDEAVSYTMSGRAAVSHPLSDIVTEPRIGSLLMFHYPTIWNHVLGDHVCTFRVLPIGPMQTQLTSKWLVHKDAVEGTDYTIEELTHVWTATNSEDQHVVEENQIGICSPAYEPGPYAPEHEDGTAQFVDWYCRTMQRGLGGAQASISRVA
jgi:glycine betaine catabolism A